MRNRTYQHFLIPLLFILAPFLILRLAGRKEIIHELVSLLPGLVFGVVAFLGYKLNQRRIVLVGLLFTAALSYLDASASSVPVGVRAQLIALALAFSLAGLFCVPEKHLAGWRIVPAIGVVLGPLWVFHLAAAAHQAWLGQALVSPAFGVLPRASLPPLVFFLILVALASDPYLQIFRLYILAALVPVGLALSRAVVPDGPGGGPETAFCFFCAGALLCYGVFYLYWRKVYLDELMGIPNRRALNERLSRLSGQYTIAMVDIDHFKRFNDTYGHEQGDTVLRFVASHLARNLHGEAYRYGGEEIAVVFEGKATPYGANEMESVRESLAKREFRIRSSNEARKRTSRRNRAPAAEWSGISVRVTVSVGVASFSREGQRPEEVLSAADLALYRAKQSGRNKVVAVQETAVETMRAA